MRPRQRPGPRRPSMLALLLALLPACCTSPPAPAPTPAAALPEPPPPPPPVPAARPVLHAAWSFQSEPDACVAVARAGAASLEIAVPRDGPIRLTLALPGSRPTRPVARFQGPAGRWLIPGTHAGRRLDLFTLARDETSLSRILVCSAAER